MEKISAASTSLAHNNNKKLTEISLTNTTASNMLNMEFDSKPKLAQSSVRVNVPARANFRKSNTCGSLYAKCNCSHHSQTIIPLITATDCDKVRPKLDRHSSKNQSFSHPDTPVIFTEKNRYPVSTTCDLHHRPNRTSQESIFKNGNHSVEIKHSKRSSSPNIGFSSLSNVEIHPEFNVNVQVIPEASAPPETQPRRKPILKKGSKSFPSATRSFRFDSGGDRAFSSYSVDEESEEIELSEQVSGLIVTDLDASSTSLTGGATTVAEVYQESPDEKSAASQKKLEQITAEKFFQVNRKLLSLFPLNSRSVAHVQQSFGFSISLRFVGPLLPKATTCSQMSCRPRRRDDAFPTCPS